MAGLVRDKEGNLYGTTIQGGIESCVFARRVIGCGTVFKLDASGNETVLYSFTGGTDAAGPTAALVRDKEGNLYGTTNLGGTGSCNFGGPGCGTVFRLDTTGKETVLHSFTNTPDGAIPYAGLIMDKAGNLYGTTLEGGAYGYGAVFKLVP
jgi:uncharacterized repeat protein (TIGR03803 family)